MTTFFLNRLATEPHALAFAGQSTPWPVALADQTTDPSLDEALRGHVAAAGRLLTPVAADLLATTGRPVDLFGFEPNPARLGAAAAASASVPGIALTQLGALLDAAALGYNPAQAKPVSVLGAAGAVNIIHRKDLQKAKDNGKDVEALRAKYIADYERTTVNANLSLEMGEIDAMIDPEQTRETIIESLRLLASKKRVRRTGKHHGNQPL